jgi:hypothetical protein
MVLVGTEHHWEYYTLVMIYVSIALFSLIGGILYRHAYIQMKKSRIIGCVSFLMFVVALDAAWWGFSEFTRFFLMDGFYSTWQLNPFLMMGEKLLLLAGVLCFVVSSVKTEPHKFKSYHEAKEARDKCRDCPIKRQVP